MEFRSITLPGGDMDEREPLSRYAAEASPEAFRELVRQNADLVYGSARRQLGDEHLAEDVTQAVFLILARKAGRIRGSLTGWLLAATCYACRDARRVAARREFHERRAAQMRSEVADALRESRWEDYEPHLDEALSRLRPKYRDSVSLRYLRGLSLKEVGASLGITEEAARKRVDRGVDRLRELMAAKATVPAAAVVATQLAAGVARAAAPAHLVESIASAGGAAAKGTLGSMIAARAGHAMALAKAKLAAVIVAAVAITGAGAGTVAKIEMGKSAPMVQTQAAAPVAAPVAPAAPAEIPEAAVPGEIELVRWDVILTDAGADDVLSIARPVKTASKFYKAFTANGAEVRRAVAEAASGGGMVLASSNMQVFRYLKESEQSPHSTWGVAIAYQNLQGPVRLQFYSQTSENSNDHLRLLGTDTIHIQLNDPRPLVMFSENRGGNWRDIAVPPTALNYSGDISAGNSLLMTGRYPGASGRGYNHFIIWETFKAKANQMQVFWDQTDSGWWWANGPDRARQWGDAARAWAASAPTLANLAPPYAAARKLSDGKTLWLDGLARPANWPGCWWDVHGEASSLIGGIRLSGSPPGGLWFHLALDGPISELDLQEPNRTDNYPSSGRSLRSSDLHQEGDRTTSLTVGAPVGNWAEIGRIKNGQTIVADGIQFHASLQQWSGDKTQLEVTVDENGLLDDVYNFTVVKTNGREVLSGYTPEGWAKYGRDSVAEDRRGLGLAFARTKLSDVAYVRVLRRKREFVTFDGFATEPLTAPALQVTPEQADQAEADRRVRQRKDHYQELVEKRKAWAAVPRDPATPQGMFAILVDDAKKGDERGARRMFLATDSQLNKFLDSGIHMLVLMESLRANAARHFGEEAVDEQLGDEPLFQDIEPGLMEMPIKWRALADGSGFVPDMEDGQWVRLRKGKEGGLQFDCDMWLGKVSRMEMLAMQVYIQSLIPRAEELNAWLKQDMPVTMGELKAKLVGIPQPPEVGQ